MVSYIHLSLLDLLTSFPLHRPFDLQNGTKNPFDPNSTSANSTKFTINLGGSSARSVKSASSVSRKSKPIKENDLDDQLDGYKNKSSGGGSRKSFTKKGGRSTEPKVSAHDVESEFDKYIASRG